MSKMQLAPGVLLFAVTLSLGWSSEWQHFPDATPAAFTPSVVVCDSSSAIVLGAEHGDIVRGSARMFERETAAFKIGSDQVSRLGSAGSGDFAAASKTPSGVLYAVVREPMSADFKSSALVDSVDSGTTWRRIPSAPPELVGIAFDSEDSGYSWSRERIYATRDGGKSWVGADAPGNLIPEPVIATDGALWVAVGHWDAGGNQVSELLRFSRDLEQTRLPWDPGLRIGQMAAAKAGGLWLIADQAKGEGLRLVEVSSKGEVGIRGSLPHALPDSLQLVNDRILVLLSDIEALRGRRLIVSGDKGASWEDVDLPEPRVWRTCAATSERIWVIGSAGAAYLSH